MEPQAHKDHVVLRDLSDLLVQMALQVPVDLLDLLVLLAFKVQLGQEQLVPADLLDLLVLLDL